MAARVKSKTSLRTGLSRSIYRCGKRRLLRVIGQQQRSFVHEKKFDAAANWRCSRTVKIARDNCQRGEENRAGAQSEFISRLIIDSHACQRSFNDLKLLSKVLSLILCTAL